MNESRCLAVVCLLLVAALPAGAQEAEPDSARTEAEVVWATVESALAAISDEDWVGLTDLVLDEGLMIPIGRRDGEPTYSVMTRTQQREYVTTEDFVERGFEPVIHVAGDLAVAWVPYDFFIDGQWSHCGTDAFTLVRTPDGWRIATLAWTIQQPPSCSAHPDGPP